MNALSTRVPETTRSLARDIDFACRRIAPSFPLDRFVAVNPWWGHVAEPIEATTAELGLLHGARTHLPRTHWRSSWRQGRLCRHHLERALAETTLDLSIDEVVAAMHEEEFVPMRLPTVLDLADESRSRSEPQTWTEVVVQQISQHAAAWFDRAQSSWGMGRGYGLYGSWQRRTAQDRSLPRRTPFAVFAQRVEALPETPRACIEMVDAQLGLVDIPRREYLTALLGSVRGWAGYCAYERWQRNLVGAEDDQLVHLLGIRAAWESLLLKELSLHHRLPALRAEWERLPERRLRLASEQRIDWVLQRAAELAYAEPLFRGLGTRSTPAKGLGVVAEAVFCIDVRSERMRRALEDVSRGAVATRGFAGFFGLPVAFTPAGAVGGRPHLPALLPPALSATEKVPDNTADDALVARRLDALRRQRRWAGFRTGMPSAFAFVESVGLRYAIELVRDGFGLGSAASRAVDSGLSAAERSRFRPVLGTRTAPAPLAQRVEQAHRALAGMGLVRHFPRLVLLVGHGSSSANNAHAHALDCGACGGQTGEVSARLLAGLLQDPAVRKGLRDRGLDVPDSTVFVPALHDTTTDEVRMFDLDGVPEELAAYVRRLTEWFAAAGDRVRRERAPALGLSEVADEPGSLLAALRRRSRDWSETRPEWGLAGNAAMVIAPRARTRHLDLDGRVFLHDYDARTDPDGALLAQLLTAPMVVAHWINFQYLASTVDNERFGSGNKLLHDVVGEHLGVFEGNGGDLRIGLPLQSVHDGQQFRHEPLRLTVVVEAAAAAIEAVLARHEGVRHLCDHGYVHLTRLTEGGGIEARRRGGGFHAVVDG